MKNFNITKESLSYKVPIEITSVKEYSILYDMFEVYKDVKTREESCKMLPSILNDINEKLQSIKIILKLEDNKIFVTYNNVTINEIESLNVMTSSIDYPIILTATNYYVPCTNCKDIEKGIYQFLKKYECVNAIYKNSIEFQELA